ncbi:hypothetical protein LNKW23_19640 [Paralimibaculum aggregatum]|uniref:Uncharacterized protein n=1 Tax=Paralimibaculum aggregatum TaxID=3036245 RepID=A0ABQ6LK05_9RHOB|nr:hypothetical protein [Limibaculum sp. NKW23]GMG82751.1 hypothetical protein LNKW23_19640 [Limibaculum sp. NKW23]
MAEPGGTGGRPDRAARRASRRAYAARNAAVLLGLFGAALGFGLWRDNLAAVAGGGAGIAWVLWSLRRGGGS